MSNEQLERKKESLRRIKEAREYILGLTPPTVEELAKMPKFSGTNRKIASQRWLSSHRKIEFHRRMHQDSGNLAEDRADFHENQMLLLRHLLATDLEVIQESQE